MNERRLRRLSFAGRRHKFTMKIYVYIKNTEDISSFDEAILAVCTPHDEIIIEKESRRSFRIFEQLKNDAGPDGCIIIGDTASLGLNTADIDSQLDWFITKARRLVICSYLPMYKYGISQPLNKAALTTIRQGLSNNNRDIMQIPRNKCSNSDRSKTLFPDNWDELYEKWEGKEISSKEFLVRTGLKKAAFYNLITEYKAQLSEI